MPLSPTDVEDIALELVSIYGQIEADVLAQVAKKALAGDLDDDAYLLRKLGDVTQVRATLTRILTAHEQALPALLTTLTSRAYQTGISAADADVADVTGKALPVVADLSPETTALLAIRKELREEITTSHMRILLAGEQVYRAAIADAMSPAIVGTRTRRDAAQAAITRLAAAGITGYESKGKDGKTRNYSLTTYVEAATRQAMARASVVGHTERLQQRGYDLVQVSNSPEECPRCRPWEGKVLSLSGNPVTRGIPVAGTLDDAVKAGLFHPNCTHRTRLYLHGVTRALVDKPQDGAAYKARQQLRYLERETRSARKELAAAVTPEAKAKAEAKIRNRQTQIREHVEKTGARRAPHRERLGTAR